ncbi:MAG TPA: DNA cytosine methyltransferase [Mycobacteriales bacterium]
MSRITSPAAEPLKVVDLFCGAGGLSEGFRREGYVVLGGSDYDPDAMATYAVNFPDAVAITGDIREGDIRAQVVELAKDADIVVGGPPCQAFSQVRNHSRLIDDPRNSLYREFVRVVAEAQPRAFVMENVPGLAQMGVKEQVLDDLGCDGRYKVAAHLLDAADFGVPQTRKRLVFVGVHSDLLVDPPTVTGSGASASITLLREAPASGAYRLGLRNDDAAQSLLDKLCDPSDLTVVSAQQAIGDLEQLQAGRREDTLGTALLPPAGSAFQRLMRRGSRRTLANVSVPRLNRDTELRLGGVPPGGNFRDLSHDLRRRYITGRRWGPAAGEELARQHYYAYRRLHPELWAWTLNTKADAAYHYSAARALSVREFARLQSFPDRFVIVTDARRGDIPGRMKNGAAHSRYRQVGNAVPPLLAAAVARAVGDVLAAVPAVRSVA